MTRLKRFVSAVLIGALMVSLPALGQDWNAASTFYSRGVHAYFAGQDQAAERNLSRAIQSNPSDPRPYYFRAMSRLRQGRSLEARQDMQVGAAFEAVALDRWAVGSALQRVQGRSRLLLENYRRQARLDEALQQEIRIRARYDQLRDRETDSLRRPVDLPLDELVRPIDPQQVINHDQQPPSHSMGDPFADDREQEALSQ